MFLPLIGTPRLKCNRQSPCDQCEKRSITSTCHYIPYVTPRGGAPGPGAESPLSLGTFPRTKGTLSEPSMQARIRHLEHLVQVLKSQRRDGAEPGPPSGPQPPDGGHSEDEDRQIVCKVLNETAGHIVDDLRYVDSANWEAILDDITELTNNLKTVDHDPVIDPAVTKRGPVLLLGAFPQATIPEMLAHLPPRPAMDRIVARFFQAGEPAWIIFHVKTFLQNYNRFWEDPSQTTFTWLGLLFVMICHTSLFCMRGDEEIPGNLGPPLEVFDAYRVRGAQCLALDDYTKPGEYKVETLILYFGTEYLRETDAMLGTSVLLSIVLRLAMHMGFHRDPRHYPEMPPFEGEMRRRIWTVLVGVDLLVSFQFGLPGNIHSRFYDTEPPRNLLDEDFDEDTKELPPSRPESERTLTLYTIVKNRILNVFGDIVTAITSRSPVKYSEIMQLDKTLEEVHDSLPSSLRYRPFSQSLIDPINLIMQRYWIELLYQKSRSILHRKYLGIAHMTTQVAHSRLTCLDAATKTLRHQYDIHCEIQPGGRLAKERWFLSSLSVHDFLLADMILCLELSYIYAAEKSPDASASAVRAFSTLNKTEAVIPKEQLLEILRTSRSIWQTMRHESSEANRAFKILSRMLTMSTGAAFESSPESVDSAAARLDVNCPAPFQLDFAATSSETLLPVLCFILFLEPSRLRVGLTIITSRIERSPVRAGGRKDAPGATVNSTSHNK
ncbi:hypothetical protein GQ53DRAFT_177655 [Thozetella sp. PMI_491]|nr:hypothetical protein GQ53DRAFT_177655 [Thozetella sp. PMI_491]